MGKKSILLKSVTIFIFVLLLVLANFFLMPKADELQDEMKKASSDLPELEYVSVSEDDDAFLGKSDAPVTIIEFSDYQCPFCKSFYNETLPLIKENYIDTGLVKFIYRDFPIPKYIGSKEAAQSAECVGEKGGDEAYFNMHNILFEGVEQWSGSEDLISIFADYGNDLTYDIESCLLNEDMLSEVESDYNAGKSYGVEGTPTFFINGKKLVGAYPYETFKALIESEL